MRWARREGERLAQQLAAMEEKLVSGTADEEAVRLKEEQLRRAEEELEARRAHQEELNARLRAKEELRAAEDEKFASVQEEVAAKSKKLKKLWARYEQTKEEIADVQNEWRTEKDDLLDMIRERDRAIGLLSLIANNFIPPEERKKVEDRATYDAEHDTWRIEQPSVQSVHAKRPVSAVPNSKRPESAVARAASFASHICRM